MSEHLRNARLAKGYSIARLAREAGVDVKTIKSAEAGRRTPHDVTLAKIRRALGVKSTPPEGDRFPGYPGMSWIPTDLT